MFESPLASSTSRPGGPTFRRAAMNDRIATIKQLVATSSYPIDEIAVADAIIVRSLARRMVPELAFRIESEWRGGHFPHRRARSFRLARAAPWFLWRHRRCAARHRWLAQRGRTPARISPGEE
ncbi:MAG: hypothetical protein ACR2LK_08720 [Solirubrobacteraceae bacterium]